MNFSDEIAKKGGLLIQSEISDPTNEWRMFNDGSTEVEVSEFLYGFVRMTKPKRILETGTYKGVSSAYMGLALKENDKGYLETVEIDQSHIDTSKELWRKLDVDSRIISVHEKSLEYNPGDRYELLFLDSEPNLRFLELLKFYPYLEPGGYVFIHDLHPHLSQEPHEMFFGWPYATIPDKLVEYIKTDKLRVFSFRTPRGLTGFYKPGENDYNPYDDRFKEKKMSDLP